MDTFQCKPLTPGKKRNLCIVLVHSYILSLSVNRGRLMSFSDEGARRPGKLVSLPCNKNFEATSRLPGLTEVREPSPSSSALLPSGGRVGIFCIMVPILKTESPWQPPDTLTWHSQKAQVHLRKTCNKTKRINDFGKPSKAQERAFCGQAENDKGSWVLCA